MERKNILVTDQSYIENWDFQRGIEAAIGEPFEQFSMVSNKMRNRWYNIIRYFLYFINPLKLFLKRKQYKRVVCWQAFYGVVYAFYHILFGVKPINEIAITHLIYKPKKGLLGRIYRKWLESVLKSGYITCYVGGSRTHRDYLIKEFGIPSNQMHFVLYCKEDETKKGITDISPIEGEYVLGIGRSNRDWGWLINCFSKSKRKLVIICDDLYVDSSTLPKNVRVLNNVEGDEMLVYLKHCYCQVCCFQYPQVASGEMVYVQGACFSKPIVVAGTCCLTDDYVKDGVTGIVVEKNSEQVLSAVEELFENVAYYTEMCHNARRVYENEHDLYQYGKKVGCCILNSN